MSGSAQLARADAVTLGPTRFDEVRDWCLGWDFHRLLQHGEDAPHLAVIERFGWDGRALEPGFRRVRVIGRQLYVLARAACGGAASAGEPAGVVADALMRHAIGSDGQFVSRLAPDGAVLDAASDLYDIAFGLFGLAWWYCYSGDTRVPEHAERAVEHVLAKLRSPSGIGFVDRRPGPGKHLQNPHMHLFEAAIFLVAFSPRPAFRQLADELFDLARTRLFDRTSGTLAEEFDGNWHPLADAQGRVRIEPGHQFEWAWLLDRYALLSGEQEAVEIARTLHEFALRHGCDPATGLVFDAVCHRGWPLERTLRIWPNTEMLKAQVVMAERNGTCDFGGIAETIARVIRHFLSPQDRHDLTDASPGFWIDYLEADAVTLKCDHIPASTMYHILFAFSEVVRWRDGHSAFSAASWRPVPVQDERRGKWQMAAGDIH